MNDTALNVLAIVAEIAEQPMGLNAFGASSMTCREADLFAELLRAAEHADKAVSFLLDHADGDDDPEDGHHGFGTMGPEGGVSG